MTVSPSGAAARWATLSASIRGASHQARDTPNEDSVNTLERDDVTIIAVADGHGSERSPRSEQGSRIAVDVAVKTITSHVAKLANPKTAPQTIVRVGELIVTGWRNHVQAEMGTQPLTDDEVAAVGAAPPEYAYGSTILVAGVCGPTGFAVQLGDGHIVAVTPDGVGRLVFDEKPGKAATETDSLCMQDAQTAVYTKVWPIDGTHPVIVTASTDGFGDAFEDRRWFENTGRQLHGYFTSQGVEHVRTELPGWLKPPAEEYGDDTTMAILVNVSGLGGAMAPRQADIETRVQPVPPPPVPPTRPDPTVKLMPAADSTRPPTWPLIAGALLFGLVAGALIGTRLFGDDPAAIQMWTDAGLVEVDGQTARRVALPVAAAGAGPTTAFDGDVVWQITDGQLSRLDANGTWPVASVGGVGAYASVAVDGDRILAAAASGTAVVVIEADSCTAECQPSACIGVEGTASSCPNGETQTQTQTPPTDTAAPTDTATTPTTTGVAVQTPATTQPDTTVPDVGANLGTRSTTTERSGTEADNGG